MNTKPDLPLADAVHSHRGFIYFCEESLRYNTGIRAWIFFAPYLVGAVWFEPGLNLKNSVTPTLWPWLLWLAYLVLFPPVWRLVLLRTGLWRKRSTVLVHENSAGSTSRENISTPSN